MRITDKLEYFNISDLSTYSKINKRQLLNASTTNFVPVISRADFDEEASKFLEKYCPEALTNIMTVPIRDIVENVMGLRVITDISLSKNFNIFGQICFSNGNVKVYNKDTNCYEELSIERGTIMVDPDTYFMRCLGCANNTIAHEAFHWERHKVYATIQSIITKQTKIAHRCPISPKGNIIRNVMTEDEDWMEWQANGIAPKILMPYKQTKAKIEQLVREYEYKPTDFNKLEKIKLIIDQLSDFYQVSKQSAKIRMIELSYDDAREVYNFEQNCNLSTNEISDLDAFNEYINNEEFRTLFELNLFKRIENYYVINSPQYIEKDNNDNYVLTDYARENILDCTLQFDYNLLNQIEFNKRQGVFYRNAKESKCFYPEYNQDKIDKALEQVKLCQKQIDDVEKFGSLTMAQQIMKYIELNNWNSSIFQTKTGLKYSTYSKVKTKPNCKLELPIVISICVGLKLPTVQATGLINKAGYALSNDAESSAYNMIISGAVTDNVLACNAFLKKIQKLNPNSKIRLLGSKDIQ